MALSGFLVIDKPAGWTSHDVVARARKILGERRIGHAGTLDPSATGVLPLAVGSATRVVEYLADASKTYAADVTFGVETDTHDIEGVVTATADPGQIDVQTMKDALANFRGPQMQIPPQHAAIRIGGRRLYDLARQGETIAVPPRPVTMHRLEMIAWQPPVVSLLVDCSKGTYIRALARDLGATLGVGAYLSNLVRLRTGPFCLADAFTMQSLADMDITTSWPRIAYHPDAVLAQWPALLLNAAATRRWRQGQPITASSIPQGARCRAYSDTGTWLGTGTHDPDAAAWLPAKVIASEP